MTVIRARSRTTVKVAPAPVFNRTIPVAANPLDYALASSTGFLTNVNEDALICHLDMSSDPDNWKVAALIESVRARIQEEFDEKFDEQKQKADDLTEKVDELRTLCAALVRESSRPLSIIMRAQIDTDDEPETEITGPNFTEILEEHESVMRDNDIDGMVDQLKKDEEQAAALRTLGKDAKKG